MKWRRENVKKVELISLEEARKMVQEFFQCRTPIISTKTIYNKVSSKELRRYGPRHKVLLDKSEVQEKLCRHHGK